ncbi:MAG: hypothetical protein SFU99_08445 [Saprospiraceae bacterium]|nr:hypothetical protein [Saprospiraceae bacterium]
MSYEKALELIEKEKEKKTGLLDLSDLVINKIPEELTKLTHLKGLFLNPKGITEYSCSESLENFINSDDLFLYI